MNKIKTTVNKETNYIYHMLSAAKCGYDNSYGRRHRNCHDARDSAVLKQYEDLITVAGGVHNGRLYWLMVCLPARGAEPAGTYYAELAAIFRDRGYDSPLFPNAREWMGAYAGYENAIIAIADVMVRNAGIYERKVWEDSRRELEVYATQVEQLFARSDFTERCEKLVGQSLGTAHFYAMLTNSMAGGAEAIDISEDQDVFDMGRPAESALHFIGHEFVIYLLKKALKGTAAFQSYNTWALIEGLAECYLTALLGDSEFFSEQKEYIGYYRARLAEDPTLSAGELFQMAYKRYVTA